MQQESYTHYIIIFLLTFIAANLLILDIKVFSPNAIVQVSEVSTIVTPFPTPTFSTSTSDLLCPASCVSLVQQATAGGSVATSGIGAPTAESLTPQSTTSSLKREYYVPLGSGSTTKSSWEDITATETVIDPANYGTVKETYFIAALRNPTRNGQVEAQLYNVTDKHPVWNSLVIMNGQESQTITSGKITLDTGNKLYRVQLKSSINYTVSLDNAKIRIISE